MHTGRTLTVCHSLLLMGGGGWIWSPSISPLGVGLDLIPLNFPLGCGPGSDPPQFPPWVWAWIWSPSISPLGVGLDMIPLNFPLGCGTGPDSPSISPLGVLLLCPSVMAFWFCGLLIESGLLLWPSDWKLAFCYGPLIESGLLVESGLLLWPSDWKWSSGWKWSSVMAFW